MFLIKALRKPVPIDLDHEVAACTTNVQDWICRLTIKKIRPWKPPKTSHAKPNESIIIDLICTKWYHKLYIDIYFTYFESNMYETNPKKKPLCHLLPSVPHLDAQPVSFMAFMVKSSIAWIWSKCQAGLLTLLLSPSQEKSDTFWNPLGRNFSQSWRLEFQVARTIDHHTTTTTLSHVLAARATWISYSFAALAPQFPV